MHGSREVVRCFSNAEIEQLLYKHLDVAIRNFNYAPVENMAVDQDACVPPLCHAVGDAAQYPHGVRQ